MDELDDLLFEPPEIGTGLYMPGLPGGGSTIYDRSVNGHNGTIAGATWEKTEGGLWGLKYDGIDDVVELQDITGVVDLTVLAWIWIDNTTGWHGIFGSDHWSHDGDVLIQSSTTKPTLTVRGNDGANQNPTTTYTVKTWEHRGWVYRSAAKTYAFYYNGEPDGDGSYTTAYTPDLTSIVYGKTYTDRWWKGKLGFPLRFYPRELSAFEVINIFQQERHFFGV